MGETNLPLSEEDEERQFWLAASRPAMDALWGNDEDDVYEQLLDASGDLRIDG
jgi:hypothetical protein